MVCAAVGPLITDLRDAGAMAAMVLTRCVSRTSLSASGAKAIRIRCINRHYRTIATRTPTAGTVSNDACQSYSSDSVCCPA